MNPDPRVPAVGVMREAVSRAVEQSSLRAVAREVGLSPMGLRNFLDGRAPYSATKQKLYRWYLGYSLRQEGTVRIAAFSAALELLVEPFPAEVRDEAKAAVVGTLLAIHQKRGIPPPQWLQNLHENG